MANLRRENLGWGFRINTTLVHYALPCECDEMGLVCLIVGCLCVWRGWEAKSPFQLPALHSSVPLSCLRQAVEARSDMHVISATRNAEGKLNYVWKKGIRNTTAKKRKRVERKSTEGERTKDGLAHFGCGVGVGVGAHLDFISKRCCLVTRTHDALMSDISMWIIHWWLQNLNYWWRKNKGKGTRNTVLLPQMK